MQFFYKMKLKKMVNKSIVRRIQKRLRNNRKISARPQFRGNFAYKNVCYTPLVSTSIAHFLQWLIK